MTSISIILATFNRSVDLLRVLQAYEVQTTTEPFEVLVVDDASTDSTWEILQNYQTDRNCSNDNHCSSNGNHCSSNGNRCSSNGNRCSSNGNFHLHIERMERNSGPGQARNRAIPHASSPIVLFTGDDMLPEKTFLAAHLAAHRKYPDEKTAILGCIRWPQDLPVNTLMTHIDGVGAQQFSFFYLRDGHEYDFRHLYTSNVSIKTGFLKSLGYCFDADFTNPAFEDVDLGYRLAQKGLRIRYSHTPIVYHYHYHTVYSFARRQYLSGRMACILVKKHPSLANIIYGKGLRFRLLKAQIHSKSQQENVKEVERLENKLLRLLSFYEHKPQPLLDNLYILSLQYFLYKGIVDGNIQNNRQASQISAAYALPKLQAIFNWYFPLARKMEVPLPEGGL